MIGSPSRFVICVISQARMISANIMIFCRLVSGHVSAIILMPECDSKYKEICSTELFAPDKTQF